MGKVLIKSKDDIVAEALKIQGWMKPVELSGLYDLAQEFIHVGGSVLEVGSWKGKSSYVLGAVCAQKKAKLICLDNFVGTDRNEAHYSEAKNMGAKKFMQTFIVKNLMGMPVSYLVGDSRILHKKLKNKSFDLVFIDGDHNDPNITLDLDNYYPKTKTGKIFICHDYAQVCPDVVKAIDCKFGFSRLKYIYSSLVGIVKE